MQTKFSVYIAVSMDGFIAGPNGELDWLDNATDPEDSEDYGYHAFMDSVDALLMGRNTYEIVRGLGPWPYGEKRVIVLGSQPVDIPQELSGTVEARQGEPQQLAEQLTEERVERVYLDGGVTIQRFLRAGLVDDLCITRIPILLGSGIPLFGALETKVPLRHVTTQSYPSGLVQSTYTVA